jgi:hypothetical protein
MGKTEHNKINQWTCLFSPNIIIILNCRRRRRHHVLVARLEISTRLQKVFKPIYFGLVSGS